MEGVHKKTDIPGMGIFYPKNTKIQPSNIQMPSRTCQNPIWNDSLCPILGEFDPSVETRHFFQPLNSPLKKMESARGASAN